MDERGYLRIPELMRTGLNALLLRCRLVGWLLAGCLLVACGGSNQEASGASGSSNPQGTSVVSRATAMNLYPVDATANNAARLFIKVTAVGSQAVTMPLAFDTGSAGITLNALKIFPSSIVTTSGFTFPSGQSTVVYNGITVTQLNGSRAYGGPTGRTQLGNLGFATVTFGDSQGSLQTQVTPIFLYYATQSNTTPPQPEQAGAQDGIFGVDAAPNLITLGGSGANAPECTQSSTGSCWVTSILKYLSYSSGIDAGFSLTPIQVTGRSCDITTAGSCSPAPGLTIGLDSSSQSGFNVTTLTCPPATYTGPSTINSYPVCQEYVAGTSLSLTGQPSETLTTGVLFDTGTPEFILNIPSGTTVPQIVDSFEITTASGFVYSATAGTGIDVIHVQQAPAGAGGSVVGLGYFESHSLLIDFASGTQGWK